MKTKKERTIKSKKTKNSNALKQSNNNLSQGKMIGVLLTFILTVVIIGGGLVAFYQIKYPLKYSQIISKYSTEYKLEKELVASLINEESSFNKDAISKNGAMGLMQLIPSTAQYIAKELKEDFDVKKLFEPETNIKYGCFYLSYLRKKFPNMNEYLAAYNAGETTVNLWLGNKNFSEDGKNLKKIPYSITQNYTNKIISGMKRYKGRI